ncbi:hypothetical protein PGB90_007029 [Kerria lacca]
MIRNGSIIPYNKDVIKRKNFPPAALKRWDAHFASQTQLLLKTVQQKPIITGKCKKVAPGCEVLTRGEAVSALEEKKKRRKVVWPNERKEMTKLS